jgi:hypothetical protein
MHRVTFVSRKGQWSLDHIVLSRIMHTMTIAQNKRLRETDYHKVLHHVVTDMHLCESQIVTKTLSNATPPAISFFGREP